MRAPVGAKNYIRSQVESNGKTFLVETDDQGDPLKKHITGDDYSETRKGKSFYILESSQSWPYNLKILLI